MAEQTPESGSGSLSLPEHPNLEWLKKEAKRRLDQLRLTNPDAKLTEAQFDLAKRYGFSSWRALKAHIDSLTIDGQLAAAARAGEVDRLAALLDAHPEKLDLRFPPYQWTLLHAAAQHGRLAAVDLLLRRGLDVNAREQGDNTYPLHWAAAGGHLDVVRRLIDAGGDVIGHGDDHELEVIGWATCWQGCDDEPHRAVAALLLANGARHHIFSAIAMNLADQVRRIVATNPAQLNSRMSRNEVNQTPLQFAIRMNRPEMVALLVELGADPLAVDGVGQAVGTYATTPDRDRPVMEAIHRMILAELDSADRGHRKMVGAPMDLVASLALGQWDLAFRLVRDNPTLLETGGALHVMAKRNDLRAAGWLLQHGADPNARWTNHGGMTPLHLAVWHGHGAMVRILLEAGADQTIRDATHDSDALGWAEYSKQEEMVRILQAARNPAEGRGRLGDGA